MRFEYDPKAGAEKNRTIAMFAIADALNNVAKQIRMLGNGDAISGPPGCEKGAIEAFGMEMRDCLSAHTEAMHRIASVAESIDARER